jgi:hypothetical protein
MKPLNISRKQVNSLKPEVQLTIELENWYFSLRNPDVQLTNEYED